jgi:hypothetical protein
VTVENGPIREGDLLVSSSRPGYAMKYVGKNRIQVSGFEIQEVKERGSRW